jgi:hypothetical protein
LESKFTWNMKSKIEFLFSLSSFSLTLVDSLDSLAVIEPKIYIFF